MPGVIYKVDSRRVNLGELRRDTASWPAAALAVLITKFLRVQVPGSVNDPNVELLQPFEVEPAGFSPDVRRQMDGLLRELGTAGFEMSKGICYQIVDHFNTSRAYIVALPRADGRALGRVHLRMEGSRVPPKTHLYCDILTEMQDGTFLWSTSAKASLDAPNGIQVCRHAGAAPAVLWPLHEREISRRESISIRTAAERPEAIGLMERHHAKTRDFHLQRGVFSPLTTEEERDSLELQRSVGLASPGFAHTEVLAEMEKLQNKRSSWVTGIVVLVVSLILFLGAGLGGGEDRATRSWKMLAILVPVLFFHESGHYLAMRVFRYRNVKMFFLPFFGAAVSGQNYTAPGWKKAVVSLMGPLPGILLGSVLGVLGLIWNKPLYVEIALMALILNGFNLLPVLPFDGGRFMQTLLFSRHPALDVAFRIVAILAMIGLGALLGTRILLYLGILMLIGLPVVMKLGGIAAEFRRQGVSPPADEGIVQELAEKIIVRVKEAFPKGANKHNKAVATNALAVYEMLCSRAPRLPATLGLGAIYAGSVVVALVMSAVLVIGQKSDLRGFARAAVAQPKYKITSEQIVVARGTGARSFVAHGTILGDFATKTEAATAFNAMRSKLDSGQVLERFGQTLIVALPTSNSLVREQWISDFESQTSEIHVENGDFGGAQFRLSCVAPTEEIAKSIAEECEEYFQVPCQSLYLTPPWSTESAASPAEKERHRLARRTYALMQRSGDDVYEDSRLTEITKQIRVAYRRADSEKAKRLQEETDKLAREIRMERLQRLRDSAGEGLDRELIHHYLELPKAALDDEFASNEDGDFDAESKVFDSPEYQRIGARMGQVPMEAGKPIPGADRHCSRWGYVNRAGLLLTFGSSFVDTLEGPRELVGWLESKGCIGMKYDFGLLSIADLEEEIRE